MNEKKVAEVLEYLGTTRILKQEIQWQEKNWTGSRKERASIHDRLSFIKAHVQAALIAEENGDSNTALEQLRILAAIAIATLASNNPPERK